MIQDRADLSYSSLATLAKHNLGLLQSQEKSISLIGVRMGSVDGDTRQDGANGLPSPPKKHIILNAFAMSSTSFLQSCRMTGD